MIWLFEKVKKWYQYPRELDAGLGEPDKSEQLKNAQHVVNPCQRNEREAQ